MQLAAGAERKPPGEINPDIFKPGAWISQAQGNEITRITDAREIFISCKAIS
jgi:hypothetical protein